MNPSGAVAMWIACGVAVFGMPTPEGVGMAPRLGHPGMVKPCRIDGLRANPLARENLFAATGRLDTASVERVDQLP